MISSIIFSKDRALQLDLLLNSIYKNFPETSNDIRVIWTASSDRFELGYKILQEEHKGVIFDKQSLEFFYDFHKHTCEAKNKYICLFTDDDIVYRKVNPDAVLLLDDYLNFVCYSLRLGTNITHRYINSNLDPDIMPILYSYENFIIWNRTSIPPHGYWSYPYSVDGHIFKKEVLQYVSQSIMHWETLEKFQKQPNQLEAKMQRFNCEYGALMICDETSSVINSPNNRVQDVFHNKHGDHYSFSQEYCNNQYLIGKRLHVDKINFDDINTAHKELNILEGLQ